MVIRIQSTAIEHQLTGLVNSMIENHPLSQRERCISQGHTWLEYERPQSPQLTWTDVCKWCGLTAICKSIEDTNEQSDIIQVCKYCSNRTALWTTCQVCRTRFCSLHYVSACSKGKHQERVRNE